MSFTNIAPPPAPPPRARRSTCTAAHGSTGQHTAHRATHVSTRQHGFDGSRIANLHARGLAGRARLCAKCCGAALASASHNPQVAIITTEVRDTVSCAHTNKPIFMGGTFQQYLPEWSSRLQLHRACKSLSLASLLGEILRVRARAYQVTVQFPKELVRSDRRARAAARCMVNLEVIFF